MRPRVRRGLRLDAGHDAGRPDLGVLRVHEPRGRGSLAGSVLLHLDKLLRGHVQPGRELGMGKGRNGADPFVIALAVARDGVVVTEEYKGTLASPEIPVVCEAFAVRRLTTVEFVHDQGWTF
jgi:hypothetical protein